ncbi:MAG: S8 family serine peptidase [Vicinamibacteria bacterium]|nr:S8 family serine peptidase [Vicinamibacteria bacterium]
MSAPFRTPLLRAALVVAASAAAVPAASQEAGAAVYETLRAEGRARVIVSFRVPEVGDLGASSDRIAQVRQRVLFDLMPGEWETVWAWDTIPGAAGLVSPSGLRKLLSDPNVERVDVDAVGFMATQESAGLIRANDARASGATGAGIVVAVLDTGADTDHPDLADDIVGQECFCEGNGGAGCCPNGTKTQSGAGAAEDDQGHGTHVAGVISGGGSAAPRGIAPDAKLIIYKVLGKDGSGSSSGILSALDQIAKSKPEVKVVNLSIAIGAFGGSSCDSGGSINTSFATVVNTLKNRGTVVVASSGNSALTNQIALPACLTNAVGVGAVYDAAVGPVTFGCTDGTTDADQVACFSNSSPAVDLVAPGAAITSTGMGGGAATFIGTSQAAPHVAAAAAAMLSANGGLSVDAIVNALKGTGQPVSDKKAGLDFKRIDVKAALDSVR